MKVIAKIDRDKFICEVSNSEVEKFMDLYYDKMPKLEVGQIVDLGKGHDFSRTTVAALNETKSFLKSHKDVIDAITSGILVMSKAAEKVKA